jgi:PAS domain S-box-containing protein
MPEANGPTTMIPEQQAAARLAAIVESSEDAIIGKTLEGIITSWNRGAQRIYGYAAAEVLGRHISLLAPPDRADEINEVLDRVRRGGHVEHLETVRITRDGRSIDVSLTVSPVLAPDGGIAGMATIARDITEAKRLEKQLRESEKRYHTQIELAAEAIVVHLDGRFVYANCAALGLYGATSLQELQQVSMLDLVHPEERAAALARIRSLLGGEEVPLRECRLLRLDGQTVPVETSSVLIDYQGRPSIQMISRDISERKRVEQERDRLYQELDDQRSRFETVLQQMPIGVTIAEAPNGRMVYHNEASSRIFRAEIPVLDSFADYAKWRVFRPDGSLLPVEDYPLVRAMARGETVTNEELKLERGDGSPGFVSVNAAPIRDHSGQIVSGVAVFSDITERKLAEEQLRDSELRHRLLFETSPQGIVYHDAQDRIVMANPTAQRILGRSEAELLGKTVPELGFRIEREDGTLFRDSEIPSTVAMRTGQELRDVVLKISNSLALETHWLSISSVPLFDAGSKRPYQVYATFEDITRRVRAEEALRASEAKFRWLFESNLIAIFFWNKDGKITQANQAYCDLVGISPGECQAGGLSWLDSTPAEYFARDFAAVEEIMAQGVCRPYEKEFVNRRDGRRVPVLCAGARMIEDGSQGMGFAIDLTELKRAEQAMRDSEATLKLAIETTGLGTFDQDLVTGEVHWSEIAKEHFGLPPDARVDCDTFALGVDPEDRRGVEAIIRDALAPGGVGKYSAKFRTIGIADGRERWISERGQAFFNARGEPVRVVGACLDITDIVTAETTLKDEITERLRAVEEMRRQEQLLIRQGRMAALGEMIGNIAHQWRQPLNTLALIIQELPWYYNRNQFSKEYLEANVTRAMQVINHMSKTIDGFRNFFEPDKEKVTFRVSEVLAQTVSIVEAAFNELSLEIEVHADPEVFAYGCPNEFSQVILNILVNAKDAVLDRKVESPRVVLRLFRENGRAVLTISDNAGGVPPEIIDRIFDPYFTTKGPDRGTGIGLFMSRTIVEKNMNGTLSVRNTEQGAEFRIEV